jgi:hypothetical protein
MKIKLNLNHFSIRYFMKKTTFHLAMIILFPSLVMAQQWQQTQSTPSGSGVTNLVIRENGDLYVTTASNDWPSGDMGGIRKSTDNGESWSNLMDAYNGRTIVEGTDGHLYASVWPYPSDEGLYRSVDDGNTWQQLTTVSSGNNIFSIATDQVDKQTYIYAGTRNGILRSVDNGASFAPSISGFDPDSYVYDLDVDPQGIIAAATSTGLYISEDHGSTWTKADGVTGSNPVSRVQFYSEDPEQGGKEDNRRLVAGYLAGNEARLAIAYGGTTYLLAVLLANFYVYAEVSGLWIDAFKKIIGVSLYPYGTSGGGYYQSLDMGLTFALIIGNLLDNIRASTVKRRIDTRKAPFSLYMGLFEGGDGGAKIYFMQQDISGVENQNFFQSALNMTVSPNPFNDFTHFSFTVPKSAVTELKIFDGTGKLIFERTATLVQGDTHEITWRPKDSNGGIYFYLLQGDGFSESGKIVRR